MIEEFKKFAIKGNAVDMAVGIVIGAAFGTVVQSLVNDVITPPIGRVLGGVDFSNLYINLSSGDYESLATAQEAGAVTLNYGLFINSVVSFLIVAWVLFFVVRGMNALSKKEEEEEIKKPTKKNCPYCKSSIHAQATRCSACTADLV
ncbi:MAG: large-conductance mechanosensitive channel protein MscL [Candidatus Moranbacteria bacterium]|nr:large-conductance mechanosensitive channel protein MscL [Candidatus Moranbacteria bacterium]